MSLKESLARIPVLGHGLKVLYHIINLPDIHRDLLAEVRHVGELGALQGRGLERAKVDLAHAQSAAAALQTEVQAQRAKLLELENSYTTAQAHSTESLRQRLESVAGGMTIVSDAILELKGQASECGAEVSRLRDQAKSETEALAELRHRVDELAGQLAALELRK